MEVYSTLSAISFVTTAAAWAAMWQCWFSGECLGIALCGQAGMGAVWFAMRMASFARRHTRELRMQHTQEILGSLLPKVKV